MRPRTVLTALLMAALAGAAPTASPARSTAEVETQDGRAVPRAEVLVFEAAGCRYCVAFRDNLGARYLSSTTNTAAPLRYIDATRLDPNAFQLRTEITIVPTIVLMQDGREVDRVEGYPVSEALFGMVKSRVGTGAE